jgi:DNA-binding LacI/PurR family transcriptional regulator
MNGKRVTILDVARLAGVDRSVVSKVLSGDTKLSVRPETRDRVLDAVRKLDYKPNYAARSLRTSRASAYGLIVPDFENSVYSRIIEGAQDAALAIDCVLLSASVNSPGVAIRKLADVLGNGTVDGLLIAGTTESEELVRLFRAHGRPVLSLNRRIPGLDRYLVLDDERASEVATRALLALGHERIGHVAGPRHSDTAERRLEGFLRAMGSDGHYVHPIAHADYTPRGGYLAMQQLLALPDRPTGVVVANVASAIGALSAAQAAGVRIPDDLSVISVHDNNLAEYASPPLTVVRMPLYELGRRGIELITAHPADAEIREVVREPLDLVERGSTRQR